MGFTCCYFMIQLSPRVFVRLFGMLAAIVVIGATATLGYLFSTEDYTAQPGSPVYFLGISPLIRQLKVPDDAQHREYFGSVGDGNKPAQSQLSFKVRPENADRTWNEVTLQLQNLNLHRASPDSEETASVSNLSAVSPGIREAEYISANDLVVVSTHHDVDADATSVRFEITHFD